ncbi:MAG: glycosyltransferase family 4 protein, partial [Deferribacteraceae bacterium]|nr:glycosyltransferase family 4 protein [Deferribacteraceae bacterium]
DYKYKISSSNPNFGRWQIAGRDKFNVDSNLIDDWMDENLLSFTKILHWIYKFELCMCQYVFTSKIFSMFDENTLKILSTLDIFSNRNSRLQPVGIAPYYFSCSVEEEKRAFERADKIIAIQREDAKFFKANTDKPVHTIPYLTKKKYLAQKNINGKLSVGYLASTNEPNIHAIERFISCIKGVDTVHLHIAGSISDSIKQRQDNVSVIGSVVDIEKFYTEHDLYINPDEFDSGLKIKTVEALAYGRPIICTAASSSGIDVSAPYHLAKDAAQCADLVRACIDNNTLLQEMHDESMRVYDSFVDKYKEQCTLKELI